MNKLFKTAMFGYKKKSVNEYIELLSSKTQKALDDAEDKIEELEKQIEKSNEALEEYKNNASSVSNAIIIAEKKAGEIILEAQIRADESIKEAEKEISEKKEALERETKEAQLKLKQINEEIRQLKTNIVISANKYTKELESLMEE